MKQGTGEGSGGTGNKAPPTRRKVLVERAQEASEVIGRLTAAGLSLEQIADEARVSERTIYRWWKEGRAPHPLMLDGLRKLEIRKGIR